MNNSSSLLRNPCVWYLGAWCLYNLQGILYAEGSTLSQILLFIVLFSSVLHTIRVLKMPCKPVYFKGLNALMVMYSVYGLLLLLTDGAMVVGKSQSMPSLYYLKSYYMALLPIYSCYYYSRRGYLTETLLSYFVFIFIGVGISVFFRMQRDFYINNNMLNVGSSVAEFTNSSGYVMLSIIPSLLVFNKKPLIQYFGIGICIVFIMLSMKRGAIICAALFLVIFAWWRMKMSSRKYKLFVMLLIVLGVVLLTNFTESLISNSDYAVSRIEQTKSGDDSHRGELYSDFINTFSNETGFLNQIFGYGAYGTIKVGDSFAHNDWLETLINQGILGVFILVFYCLVFYRTFRSRVLHPESRFALMVIFLFFFAQSFFSAGITNTTIFTCCMTGFALANGFSFGTKQ